MDFLQFNYAAVAVSFAHVVLGVLVLVIAKLALSVFSPYATDQEMTTRDNPAFGLAVSGYYASVALIYVSAAGAAPLPLDSGLVAVLKAMGADVASVLAGIVALSFGRWCMDRLLVPGVRNDREITTHRNLAAGALECGGYVAAGLIVSGALRQPGGTPWTATALFLLSQAVLILAGHAYQRWAGYKVAAEVASGNLAAGVAFGLSLVALAVLLLKAISGEFVSWPVNLSFFAFDAIAGLVLLMLLRWATDLVLLPGAQIAEEIVRDRNVNVGLIEGVLAVGIAAIILKVF